MANDDERDSKWSHADHDPAWDDGGGNRCGCPVADGACSVVSAGLEPPKPSL